MSNVLRLGTQSNAKREWCAAPAAAATGESGLPAIPGGAEGWCEGRGYGRGGLPTPAADTVGATSPASRDYGPIGE